MKSAPACDYDQLSQALETLGIQNATEKVARMQKNNAIIQKLSELDEILTKADFLQVQNGTKKTELP